MKKIIYTLIALSAVLWSCGGGGGETPSPPTPVNNAPATPTLVYPTDNLLCIDNVLDFDWNASTDSDGDSAITYQVQVATDAQFTQLIHSVTTSSTLRTLSLEKGIAYYWRTKATDSKGASSSYSVTNQFYTEGEGESNHLPFTPVLVTPALNTVVSGAPTTTNLQWTADDVDNDALTYDVYFDTNNPPTAIDNGNKNISSNSASVTLAASTSYYWKVIVKDGQGGQTIGQVWNFTTD